jgi:hypothetical protein
LKSLQDQDEASKQEAQSNGWWPTISSSFHSKSNGQEQEKKREQERLQRVARRRIIENEMKQGEDRLQQLKDDWRSVVWEISAIRQKIETEAWTRRMEEERQQREDEEAMKRAKEERRRRWQEECRERQAEAQRAEVARHRARAEAQARAREQEGLEKRIWADFDAETARRVEERRRFQSTRDDVGVGSTTASQRTNCRHDKFWPQVGGPHHCWNCQTFLRYFAFQCPGCRMIACMNCRQTLRDGRGRR